VGSDPDVVTYLDTTMSEQDGVVVYRYIAADSDVASLGIQDHAATRRKPIARNDAAVSNAQPQPIFQFRFSSDRHGSTGKQPTEFDQASKVHSMASATRQAMSCLDFQAMRSDFPAMMLPRAVPKRCFRYGFRCLAANVGDVGRQTHRYRWPEQARMFARYPWFMVADQHAEAPCDRQYIIKIKQELF
jgi:hypothetical protein